MTGRRTARSPSARRLARLFFEPQNTMVISSALREAEWPGRWRWSPADRRQQQPQPAPAARTDRRASSWRQMPSTTALAEGGVDHQQDRAAVDQADAAACCGRPSRRSSGRASWPATNGSSSCSDDVAHAARRDAALGAQQQADQQRRQQDAQQVGGGRRGDGGRHVAAGDRGEARSSDWTVEGSSTGTASRPQRRRSAARRDAERPGPGEQREQHEGARPSTTRCSRQWRQRRPITASRDSRAPCRKNTSPMAILVAQPTTTAAWPRAGSERGQHDHAEISSEVGVDLQAGEERRLGAEARVTRRRPGTRAGGRRPRCGPRRSRGRAGGWGSRR